MTRFHPGVQKCPSSDTGECCTDKFSLKQKSGAGYRGLFNSQFCDSQFTFFILKFKVLSPDHCWLKWRQMSASYGATHGFTLLYSESSANRLWCEKTGSLFTVTNPPQCYVLVTVVTRFQVEDGVIGFRSSGTQFHKTAQCLTHQRALPLSLSCGQCCERFYI